MEVHSLSDEFKKDAFVEARAEAFWDSLPFYFKVIDLDPSEKKKIYELGVKSGVDKKSIDAEFAKWLKNKKGKIKTVGAAGD